MLKEHYANKREVVFALIENYTRNIKSIAYTDMPSDYHDPIFVCKNCHKNFNDEFVEKFLPD